MKHLFIINPTVDKIRGRVNEVIGEIEYFFSEYRQFAYDIHITRWARDAVGYIRRYASDSPEIVRVHVLGGSGTLFEAVNGIIGLPNTQLAAYPMGRSNYFLRYFGDDKLHVFDSLRNQIFAGAISIDVLRCGNNYGISHGLVGIEAVSGRDGVAMIEKTHLPVDFCYKWSVLKNLMISKKACQHYDIMLDGFSLGGNYITMMIANSPCYGKNMCPAPEAHPNDGQLEAYFIREMPKLKRISTISRYANGNYSHLPNLIFHHSGKKINISSDTVMSMSIDGELFYEKKIEYELMPYAIDFACPAGIDLAKLPRVRKKAKERFKYGK